MRFSHKKTMSMKTDIRIFNPSPKHPESVDPPEKNQDFRTCTKHGLVYTGSKFLYYFVVRVTCC
jgi:hypothetical protein